MSEIKPETLELDYLAKLEVPVKNYKIVLLTDIINKIRALKKKNNLKKHQYIDLFIQATPDFLEFIQKYEEMFMTLLKITKIKYLKLHEKIEDGYTTDMIINMTMGIKAVEMEEQEVEELPDTKQILEEKKAHLQYLRSMISGLSAQSGDASEEKLKQKKKEFERTKKEIDELEFQYQKEKMRD